MLAGSDDFSVLMEMEQSYSWKLIESLISYDLKLFLGFGFSFEV